MNKPRYEPLSAAHFEVMAQLWADSEVIRYTAVERPCTPAQPRPGGKEMNELCYEPLSAAYFEVMARLWADPEVIRYTAVERPCTPAQPRPGGQRDE